MRRACTCGCTEAIQAVFEAGEEVSRKEEIQEALDDMVFFVHRHVERINEYQQFADGLLKTIQEKRSSSPGLKPFLDSLEEIAQQIPQECAVQQENMKTFGYVDDLSRKTIALTAKKDPNNMNAYLALLKTWREMGGAQDYVLAKCHTITRSLGKPPAMAVRLCLALFLWPRTSAHGAVRPCGTRTVMKFGPTTKP